MHRFESFVQLFTGGIHINKRLGTGDQPKREPWGKPKDFGKQCPGN